MVTICNSDSNPHTPTLAGCCLHLSQSHCTELQCPHSLVQALVLNNSRVPDAGGYSPLFCLSFTKLASARPELRCRVVAERDASSAFAGGSLAAACSLVARQLPLLGVEKGPENQVQRCPPGVVPACWCLELLVPSARSAGALSRPRWRPSPRPTASSPRRRHCPSPSASSPRR